MALGVRLTARSRRILFAAAVAIVAVLVLTMTASPAQAKEVQGTSGPDTLFGTSGNDRAYGYAGGDYIEVLRLRDCQQGYNVLVEGIIA